MHQSLFPAHPVTTAQDPISRSLSDADTLDHASERPGNLAPVAPV